MSHIKCSPPFTKGHKKEDCIYTNENIYPIRRTSQSREDTVTAKISSVNHVKIVYLSTHLKTHTRYPLQGDFMCVEKLNLSSILSTVSCAPYFLAAELRAVCLQTSWPAGLEDKRSKLPCLRPKLFRNENQNGHSEEVMDSFRFELHEHARQFQVHISQRKATIQLCHSFIDMVNFGATVLLVQQRFETAPKHCTHGLRGSRFNKQ